MHVRGFLKNTLVDYPGRIASTLFLPGCNFHCGFCHNPDLVHGRREGELESIDLAEIFDYLKKASARGFVDGVCITGGEPTLYGNELQELMVELKNLGLAIKLDTNGSNPSLLSTLPIDYLALDLKTSLERYNELTSLPNILEQMQETISFLHNQKNFDYEFRTTLVPGLVDEAEIHGLGSNLQLTDKWFFQNFRNHQVLDPAYLLVTPYDDVKVHSLVELARKYAKATIR